ncbi:MAG: GHKL domain-containing protein [Lachnospiraceae bacterium]|nr:GHKL domain-containing protein [Lachnospiraceae bacterium]
MMIYWIGLHILDFFTYLLIYRVIFHAKIRKSIGWITGLLLGSCALMAAFNEFGIFSYGGQPIALTCCIALLILTQESRFRAFLLFPIAFFMSGSINILFSYFFSFLLQVSYKEYLDSKMFKLLTEIPLLVVLIALWLRSRKKKEESLLQFSIPKYLIILLGAVCIFFVVAVSQGIMLGKAEADALIQPMAVGLAGGGVVFIGLVIWQIVLEMRARKYQLENEYYRNYLEKQETHIRDIIEADQKIRSFRHDMRAHLTALEAGVAKEDIDFLKQYLARMKEENNSTSIEVYTGSAAVDAVIGEWREKADKGQVKWHWDGSLLKNTNLEPFDLCVIFSNLLSNAVEAALQIEEGREKKVDVYSAIFQENLIIRVANTCRMDAQMAEAGRTTKSDHANHGFGTKNVQDIVKKYQGTMESKVSDGQYIVEIMI